VLKKRRVAGVDTLILRREPDQGSFAVPRAWTDLAAPSGGDSDRAAGCYLDCRCLLSLIEVLGRLETGSSPSSVPNPQQGS